MKEGWKARPDACEQPHPSSLVHTKDAAVGEIFSRVPVAHPFSKETWFFHQKQSLKNMAESSQNTVTGMFININ